MKNVKVHIVICSYSSTEFNESKGAYEVSVCPYYHGIAKSVEEAREIMSQRVNDLNEKINGVIKYISDNEVILTAQNQQARWKVVPILE